MFQHKLHFNLNIFINHQIYDTEFEGKRGMCCEITFQRLVLSSQLLLLSAPLLPPVLTLTLIYSIFCCGNNYSQSSLTANFLEQIKLCLNKAPHFS